MKFNSFNSTVLLTFILLAMMLGAGTVSAFWAFTLGDVALKGVTQPDVNPTKKLKGDQKTSEQSKKLTFLKEKDIITKVDNYIRSQSEQEKPSNSNKEEKTENKDKSAKKTESSSKSLIKANFPLSVQDQGVTFEVVKASQQGGSLLLDVNLKNNGTKAVQFLYSFLEVKDDKGQSLSAITEDLPGELPPNGEIFSGVVKIPSILIEENQQISLNLTDYPDQKLQLNIAKIPVVNSSSDE